MLAELEELCAGVDAPDAHRPLSSGWCDESSAVGGERDVGVVVRLRPWEREDFDFAAAGRCDVPDPSFPRDLARRHEACPGAVERDACNGVSVATERQG